tara:strand:+ start:523 stop:735 length:213 start_codon:yes stop_codon:yes gene_type:complete
MNTRKPLRPANLKDLLTEVLNRLGEFSDEQLEDLSMATNQHLFDRDCQNDNYGDYDIAPDYEDRDEDTEC